MPYIPSHKKVNPEGLYSPREVADIFGVDPKTVTRWAKTGKLMFRSTVGGHRRYLGSDLLPFLPSGSAAEPGPAEAQPQ